MRTFIAIDLPDVLKEKVALLQEQIHSAVQPLNGVRYLRWTGTDKMHLTLRFLGETTVTQQTQLSIQLAQLCSAQSPIRLNLTGLGAFPNWSRLRVVWTGVAGEVAPLKELQQGVEQIARASEFTAENKSFSPHITLARIERNAPGAALRELGQFLNTWAAEEAQQQWGSWTVRQVIHMRSQLRPQGAIYTPLARFPLEHRPAND
jgi:RNA 2',3'-cyclic 3'-phosphodiesterase